MYRVLDIRFFLIFFLLIVIFLYIHSTGYKLSVFIITIYVFEIQEKIAIKQFSNSIKLVKYFIFIYKKIKYSDIFEKYLKYIHLHSLQDCVLYQA